MSSELQNTMLLMFRQRLSAVADAAMQEALPDNFTIRTAVNKSGAEQRLLVKTRDRIQKIISEWAVSCTELPDEEQESDLLRKVKLELTADLSVFPDSAGFVDKVCKAIYKQLTGRR